MLSQQRAAARGGQPERRGLVVATINADGVRGRLQCLVDGMQQHGIDVLAIQEAYVMPEARAGLVTCARRSGIMLFFGDNGAWGPLCTWGCGVMVAARIPVSQVAVIGVQPATRIAAVVVLAMDGRHACLCLYGHAHDPVARDELVVQEVAWARN